MSDSTTAAVESRIVLRSRITPPDDAHPWEYGPATLERHPSGFRIFDLYVTVDGKTSVVPLRDGENCGAAEAWRDFANDIHYNDATAFVGPGTTPVVFESLVIEPAKFRVFDVTLDRPVLVGDYWHRLAALEQAKAIVKSGGCPLVVSPHWQQHEEWDDDVTAEDGGAK